MHSRHSDSGIALVSALLVLLLLSSLVVGFTAVAMSDARVRSLDQSRTQAFYAAHAGLEQLTADLGDLFASNYAPSGAVVDALTTNGPTLQGVSWIEPDESSGYTVRFPRDASGNPLAEARTVASGPYQGFVGLATPYRMQVTARLADRSEVTLTRTLQTVGIPVFQFGMFDENNLSFFAGPAFNFGGRVHTNANLFLASGSTLTLADRVTTVGEVIRTELSNGWDTNTNYTGTVRVMTAPNAFRNLARTEGSLVGGPATAQNEPLWTSLTTGVYNNNLVNGRTGARRLDLPVVRFGATPIDLIRRPVPNEDTAQPLVLSQRFYSLASLRILLSDTAADLLALPGVTADAPVPLGNLAVTPVAGYTSTPFAVSPGTGSSGVRTPAGTPVHGGVLKIEMQDTAGNWRDVTLEILNLGIAGRQWPNPGTGAPACAEPASDAILRLQRLRDNNSCLNGSVTATDYWPNVLYDTREALLRDGESDSAPVRFAGIMHYLELDARNLSRWFRGEIGASGASAMNVTGYVVYFSDRRGNRNALNAETGEFGFEDIVNPAAAGGAPNAVLDVGEDLNGNRALDLYGQTPVLRTGMTAPLTAAARPWTSVDPGNAINLTEESAIARKNPPIFFRRALKLVHGDGTALVLPGLTIASENPVYVQGHWNANAGGFNQAHAASAILADAVTLLSTAWSDRRSFSDPHDQAGRPAATTWYRFAVIAGKGLSFPRPGGSPQDFGTDGGAHNFLRYLESWDGQTLNFRGSIASLFISRQAVGTYKCCEDVYAPPTRGYNFDTDFLTPALLPPRTPMFRDVNITGFAQLIRPR
jgi:hypothetical protein